MKQICSWSVALVWLCAPLLGQSAQSLILPHVVDGGGWRSTIVLTNLTGSPAAATLVFHQDKSGGGSDPWNLPFLEASSLGATSVPGGASMFLHTRGTAANLTQGWGEIQADNGIVSYIIFTNIVSGRPDQDSTALAVSAASRILVPFDNASGNVAAIAIVNPTTGPESIFVTFRNSTGQVTTGALPTLPPLGHAAFVLPQQFQGLNGQTGLAEFYSSTGNFSIIALRFNATLSSTAAPVYFQSGPPIIHDPGVIYPPDYY